MRQRDSTYRRFLDKKPRQRKITGETVERTCTFQVQSVSESLDTRLNSPEEKDTKEKLSKERNVRSVSPSGLEVKGLKDSVIQTQKEELRTQGIFCIIHVV